VRKLRAILLLATLGCSPALAWGPEGHKIVGDIARHYLSATAKENIRAMLGNDNLAAISSWADEVRPQRPETYDWHFVDIPTNAAGFSEERDCYRPRERGPFSQTDRHNCVVDRITLFRRTLADQNASLQDRIEALKFLVHFVGDIHQPMHAIEEARGGNDIQVMAFGTNRCGDTACNLHYEWDVGLIDHTGRSETAYVRYLEQMIARRKLRASGTPEDWANESFHWAKRAWLNEGGEVTEEYYRRNIHIVDDRLALAGLRLAAMLNQTLGSHPTQSSEWESPRSQQDSCGRASQNTGGNVAPQRA
jgi:S1/P1 Nuclease